MMPGEIGAPGGHDPAGETSRSVEGPYGRTEGGTMRYVFGDYVLDTLRYELRQAGAAIPLRPKVFQVLAYLLAHHDRVVLKQELLEHLWPGQYVGDAAPNCYIMAVRQAIGDSGHTQRCICTIRGRGYRF